MKTYFFSSASLAYWRSTALLLVVAIICSSSTAKHANSVDLASGTITAYEHKNYRGKATTFRVGSWNKHQLGRVGNDRISSIRVPAGMEVTLYQHDTWRGKRITLNRSYNDIHKLGFGDEVSSLRVRRKTVNNYRPKSGNRLPNSFVSAGNLKVESGPSKKFTSVASLPCDCHMQGIGWSAESNQMVLTCQDKCSNDRGGYMMLYNGSNGRAVHTVKSRAAARYNHPSSIQIYNKTFPVAMADGKSDNSYIEFYKISGSQMIYQQGKDIVVPRRHIGALAYATIGNYTYMIGAGWDAKNLTIWRSNTKNATSGFYQTAYFPSAKSAVMKGIDENWSAYNSLWLGQLANGKTVLIATHGGLGSPRSWLDIWEIYHLHGSQPRFKKISKKWMGRKGMKNYFFEGTTIKMTGPSLSDLRVLAAPHDYGTGGCSANTRCTKGVYEVRAY
ncbi:MAG: hypothetical protein F6K19_27925 [Cyanothece sp. SIO1E1]|nr:hypothetical protein [Cyanothece sp. SIO1E1]